ncbi:hypothetical protein C8R45DRAFT_945395 [Mycena sanguinolenta]|nr:hypothetical protein C8R45DRAFT_945395 [Mycena sanguinolenta]
MSESSRRSNFIPEPVYFPPTKGPSRTSRNSSRGRSLAVATSSTRQEEQPLSEEEPLPFSSALTSPLDSPVSSPVQTQPGASNSPAIQNNNAALNLVQQPTTQKSHSTQNSAPIAAMDHTKLPQTYGRNALSFKGEADELAWYFDALEDIFKKTSATTDEEKKYVALHYCDSKTKRQWNAMPTAESGTWDEFKAEIRESYPEFKAWERGSVAALEKYDYVRNFRALVGQLLKGPARISNREVAVAFLKGLATTFAEQVILRMSNTPREAFTSYKKAKANWEWEAKNKGKVYSPPELDLEDRYVWTDILEVATRTCEEAGAGGYFSSLGADHRKGKSTGESRKSVLFVQGKEESSDTLKQLSDKIDQLESGRAKHDNELKDRLLREMKGAVEEAMSGHLDKFTADTHKEIQDMKTALEDKYTPSMPSQRSSSNAPPFVRNRAPDRGGHCFYCYGPGHFIDACETRKEDLNKGIIVMTNGKITFYDGKFIPREPPHKSPREKALDHYNRRAMTQNYDEAMDVYFGAETMDTYFQGGEANDPYKQVLSAIARLESQGPMKGTGSRKTPPEETDRTGRNKKVVKTPEKNQQLREEQEALKNAWKKKKGAERSAPRSTRFASEVEETAGSEEDDEQEEDPPRNPTPNELPFRDVEPLPDPPRPAVLPLQPEKTPEGGQNSAKRKPRTPKNTEAEDRANEDLIKAIRDAVIPVKLGDLLDSNPKIRRVIESGARKTRRANFVRNSEGDVLAAKVSNFLVSEVLEDDEKTEEFLSPDTEEELFAQLEETKLEMLNEFGDPFQQLMFNTVPEIVTSPRHKLDEGSVIMGDPVLQYYESLQPEERPKSIRVREAPLSAKLRRNRGGNQRQWIPINIHECPNCEKTGPDLGSKIQH